MAIAKNSGTGSSSTIGSDYFDTTTVWTGTKANNFFNGSSGDDVAHGLGGSDRLYGNDGEDALFGDVGNDVLNGGSGNDYLYGGEDDDKLAGGADDDWLEGGDGDDEILGGDGNDIIFGGAGADIAYGGGGINSFFVSADDFNAKDVIYGSDDGSNSNFIAANEFQSVTVDLSQNLLINGATGDSSAIFGIGHASVLSHAVGSSATVIGTDTDNILSVYADTGTLVAGGGNDTLFIEVNSGAAYGGDGDDRFELDAGTEFHPQDFLVNGGTGSDSVFVQALAAGSPGGVIWDDFSQAESDHIDVSGLGWTNLQDMLDDGVTITQVGGSTLIQYTGGGTLTLEGFTGTLGNDDFIFI